MGHKPRKKITKYQRFKAVQLWCDLQEYRAVLWLAASMAEHLMLDEHATKLREVAESIADGARVVKKEAEVHEDQNRD